MSKCSNNLVKFGKCTDCCGFWVTEIFNTFFCTYANEITLTINIERFEKAIKDFGVNFKEIITEVVIL